jgi:hypothetical protein
MTHLSWQVGEITITRIVKMQGTGPLGGGESPLPEAFPEAIHEIEWLIPHFANEDGLVHFSVHALLLDMPHGRLIVDTCVGNDKARTMPRTPSAGQATGNGRLLGLKPLHRDKRV